MSLEKRSLVELRGLAQSLGIEGVFQKTKNILIQEIQVKQKSAVPVPNEPVPQPVYDARLMSATPSSIGDKEEILVLLEEHIARGLYIEFVEPDQWTMKFGIKEDSGTSRQPLVNILRCANKLVWG